MVLALLKMALVICIPLVLVVGTYDLKTVVGERRAVRAVLHGLLVPARAGSIRRSRRALWLGFGWNRPHTNFDPLVGLNNAFGDMF